MERQDKGSSHGKGYDRQGDDGIGGRVAIEEAYIVVGRGEGGGT